MQIMINAIQHRRYKALPCVNRIILCNIVMLCLSCRHIIYGNLFEISISGIAETAIFNGRIFQ